MNQGTQDQIAAVMLLHGTPDQQRGALEYAGVKPTNNYRCGHCGYEGPCYGSGYCGPWCRQCERNSGLTKCA